MSDEGLKWLVEEREKWKARAEWAEAELVRRDAELTPGVDAQAHETVPIIKASLVRVEAVLPLESLLGRQTDAMRALFWKAGEAVITQGLVSAVRDPSFDALRLRVLGVRPSEGVVRYEDLGRWVHR